jgi:FKBP-type peptidyl-prolyl cis-trans isomerase
MRIHLNISIVFLLILFVYTCNNDDDETTATPPRDRTEQQASDLDTLQNYFNTHYYNSGALANLPTYPTLQDIEITKLEEDETVPENTTLLADAVEEHTTMYKDVSYKYYLLKLEDGQGDQPHFTDQVRVNYEGNLMNDTIFDSSVNPVDVDLVFSIPGWSRVLPQFRTASGYTTNGDGTVTFENYGVGVMFLPSGLSYFNSAATGIPSYSCLVFKFELHQFQVMDHDNDFIPSFMEDDNDNMDVTDDNTDDDRFSNFADTDDDGDGYKTFREIIYTTFTQTTREALEAELQSLTPASNQFITAIETEDDGSFSAKLITLEDTNGNGIPNYLDTEDAQTIN